MLARELARELHHGHVGTEHLLYALAAEEQGLGARVLEHLGFTAEGIRDAAITMNTTSTTGLRDDPPFTPRAKKVLELSLREALGLGHNYIGTEHLLLGLAREKEGMAARVIIDKLGEDGWERVHGETIRMLSGPGARKRSKPSTRDVDPVTLDRLANAMRAFSFAAYGAITDESGDRKAALANACDQLENTAKLAAAYLRGRPRTDAD